MPGIDHTLTFVSVKCMVKADWGTHVQEHSRHIRIYGDSDILFEVSAKTIQYGDRQWYENRYLANIPITYPHLNAEIFSLLRFYSGAMSSHFYQVLATVEYVPTVPPEPATVRVHVYNRATGASVGDALVRLMSGDKVVASGYTAGDGWVELLNVPGGVEGISYTLKISAGGYENYEEAKDVVPGVNEFDIPLVPIPTPPLPWWVWWLVGGVVVVGAITIIPPLLKREKPIIVVR